MLRRTIGLLLLGVSSFACAQTGTTSNVPRLVAANVPSYPPIARAARVSGWIKIHVTVNSGKVTRLDVLATRGTSRSLTLEHGSPMLTEPTLANLKTWQFGPSVNQSFDVTYTYVLSGKATSGADNPKIEISPTLDVTISTAVLELDE